MVTIFAKIYFIILNKEETQRLEHMIDFMALDFMKTHQKEMSMFIVLNESFIYTQF